MNFGPFNAPVLPIATNLDGEQRARGAALLVARQVRPGSSVTELLTLSMFIIDGHRERDQPALPQLYGDLAPTHINIPVMQPPAWNPVQPVLIDEDDDGLD